MTSIINDGRLKEQLNEVEKLLDLTLQNHEAAAAKIDPYYNDLLSQIRTFIARGGKRLRPSLVLLGYEGLGGADQSIIGVAASQELLHAFLLMHDDIIDRDNKRWGGPNLIGHYLQHLPSSLSRTDTQHYAEAWNLLGGDICYSLSQQLILNSNFSAKKIVAISQLIQQTVFTTIGGELLDTALSIYQDSFLTERQLLAVARYKTAAYSFVTPLMIGALLAGATQLQLSRIKSFGNEIGIAYQLQDDLLGMFGKEAATGKPLLSDLREGKRTLLIAYANAHATNAQRQTLRRYLGNTMATNKNLQTVQHLLKECGAQGYVESITRTHAEEAANIITTIGFNATTQTALNNLIHFSIGRRY